MYPIYDPNAAPSTMDFATPSDVGALAAAIQNGGRAASVYSDILYDTLLVDAGSLTAQEVTMFSVPIGSQNRSLVGNNVYRVGEHFTNMTNQNQLPAGNEFWSVNMQVQLVISGLLDNAVNSSGDNPGLASDPGLENQVVAADALNATNLAQVILESFSFTFTINNVRFERGPGKFWPTRYGLSGFAGGFAFVPGTAGTTIAANETAVNNGFGQPRPFAMARHIPPLYNFGVIAKVNNAFTVTRPFRLSVIMEGVRGNSITA
jgi:hypothetical protein